MTSADPGEEVKSKQGFTMVGQNPVDDASGEDSITLVEAVCVKCFEFLKALAKDYFEVQTR